MKQGWKTKKLGEVCNISTGKSNTIDAIEDGEYAFFDRSKVIKKSSKYLFDCDAIIVAGEGQTFFPKFYSGKFDLHQRAYAIFDFSANISIHYVYNYLVHFHKYFEEVAVGATAKSLRLRHFQDLPIPIPTFPEQQRIVAILDEAFTTIAKAKANAEENLKNTKELFESYLQLVFEKKMESIEFKLWDEVLEIRSGRNQKNVINPNGKYPILGSAGKVMGYSDDFICNAGTTIIGRKGTIDNPLYIKTQFWNVDTAFGLIAGKHLDKKYLYYFCRSYDFKSLDKGTTLPSLVKKDLIKIKMPLPILSEQKTIVKKLDALSIETKKLETIYLQKINDLDELKKSILQKAFSGELKTT